MPSLMRTAMGFEIKMDDDFQNRISHVLELLESDSVGNATCELKKGSESDGWVGECLWHDQNAMHAHFVSSHLQDLIALLALRSRIIKFECGILLI